MTSNPDINDYLNKLQNTKQILSSLENKFWSKELGVQETNIKKHLMEYHHALEEKWFILIRFSEYLLSSSNTDLSGRSTWVVVIEGELFCSFVLEWLVSFDFSMKSWSTCRVRWMTSRVSGVSTWWEFDASWWGLDSSSSVFSELEELLGKFMVRFVQFDTNPL